MHAWIDGWMDGCTYVRAYVCVCVYVLRMKQGPWTIDHVDSHLKLVILYSRYGWPKKMHVLITVPTVSKNQCHATHKMIIGHHSTIHIYHITVARMRIAPSCSSTFFNIAMENSPFSSMMYPLKMVMFHSYIIRM